VATGAAWEIWLQVEILIGLQAAIGVGGARELPYPAPNAALHLDLGFQDNEGQYAIELKVESATNAGNVLGGVQTDVTKLGFWTTGGFTRWAVGIAYSAQAKTDMRDFAAVANNNAVYLGAANPDDANNAHDPNDPIGVLVVTSTVVAAADAVGMDADG